MLHIDNRKLSQSKHLTWYTHLNPIWRNLSLTTLCVPVDHGQCQQALAAESTAAQQPGCLNADAPRGHAHGRADAPRGDPVSETPAGQAESPGAEHRDQQ